MCRKRYHFIIRSATDANAAYQRPCTKCGTPLQLSEARCNSCNFDISADDLEEWLYHQLEENNTHLLHGVVHANGYGHLLTLNGREGGSSLLSGSDIMGFWDRLCAAMSVRKVTVMDLSKKFGLDYRLLHAIARGHSWYGNWGYEFGTGCYALTEDAYKMAVDNLSNMPLSSLSFQDRGPHNPVQSVISLYQSLAETELRTMKDLFSFLLELVQNFRKPRSAETAKLHEQTTPCNLLCSWTRNDVEEVQQALMKVLLASSACNEAKWVTRQTLKGAVGRRIGSPELLDFGLKHLQGKSVANGMVVCSRCNPTSSAIEFRLAHVPNGLSSIASHPSKEQVISDLTFLFNSIVHPEKMIKYRPKINRKTVADSARKLLDCKQFMKDYKIEQMTSELPSALKIWCHVKLSDHPKEDHPSPPPELIVLPLNATNVDLLNEVTGVFQEVYAMYKKFVAVKLLGYGLTRDRVYTLKFLLGSTNGTVEVQGECPAKNGLARFRMERGTEEWKVDCICGTKDDDGERMLACDTCGVWLHTRCAGIDSADGMPSKFVCKRCVNSIRVGDNQACKLNTYCRDEAVATYSAPVRCNIKNVNFGVR